jgi:uncharacterized phosphosugar-binding protein
MYIEQYRKEINTLISAIFEKESEKITQAGRMLADTLQGDGLLYVFGCGHSHMLAEELFYRAGGLAAVSPIFETSTMLHEGAAKSSQIERMSGYAPHVIERYPIHKGDCFLIASNSGINPFGIEMAQSVKARGKDHRNFSLLYKDKPSRQKDGLHLPDVCDLCIDNHVPVGDATVEVSSDGSKAGPLSSLANFIIADSIALSACEQLRTRGIEPQVFHSGNCAGNDDYNARLIEKFRSLIKCL